MTAQDSIRLGRILPLVNAIAEALNCNTQNKDSSGSLRLLELEDFLPSGSGIDSGTKIDLEKSQPDKIILTFDFHHMNEDGFYDGWSTGWKVTVRPTFNTFSGIDIDIKSGIFMNTQHRRKYKDDYILDYFYDTYLHHLSLPIVHGWDNTNHSVVYFALEHAKSKFPNSPLFSTNHVHSN